MKKLILKSGLYFLLILVCLEVTVRLFHLAKDTPTRYVDKNNVEKWIPNQNGYAVTGNRRQNFSEYRINSSGYNSYREFTPSKESIDIALVGDSFIEGFHQNYYNSIGKKVETNLQNNVKVMEFGYAGYDMADQLHLIYAYNDLFKDIDYVFLGIKFSNDLSRGKYAVVQDRLALESPINKILKKSKLLVYCKSIGVLDPPQLLFHRIKNSIRPVIPKQKLTEQELKEKQIKNDRKYLENFKNLIALYGYDKDKFVLLLDSSSTSNIFLDYLNKNNFTYIDFFSAFEKSGKPTTLIYDRHWNNHGRSIIANLISSYIKKDNRFKK